MAPDVSITRDVTFRETDAGSLALDVYEPTDGTDRPAIVFLYGGEWRGGQKGRFARWAVSFADRGYVCIEPTYRLADETTLRGMATDVKTAIAWVRANAAEWDIDPDRIAVAGHSAGAHLAVLAATTPDRDETVPDGIEASPEVAAAVGFSGVYDLRGGTEASEGGGDDGLDIIGGTGSARERRAAAVSPVTHVGPETPPLLLAHARDDGIVPVSASEQLVDAVQAEGRPVTTFFPESGGHEFLFSTWAVAETMDRTADFLRRRL
ncbi:alpha/beta hydrolase [Haloarchaeobius amylolyticus]|uniref:alpha/beta hydrolase n=1 Tax=Haloarchaeobius amylolyticus TaxID=1198296 RepID=UPI002270B201|nr:alpha/beta hydrolase [Haloarchaeobius amylolyticus]